MKYVLAFTLLLLVVACTNGTETKIDSISELLEYVKENPIKGDTIFTDPTIIMPLEKLDKNDRERIEKLGLVEIGRSLLVTFENKADLQTRLKYSTSEIINNGLEFEGKITGYETSIVKLNSTKNTEQDIELLEIILIDASEMSYEAKPISGKTVKYWSPDNSYENEQGYTFSTNTFVFYIRVRDNQDITNVEEIIEAFIKLNP